MVVLLACLALSPFVYIEERICKTIVKWTNPQVLFFMIEWETCQWVTISIHRNYLCLSGACWLFGVGSSAVDNDRVFTKQLMKASISFVNNLHELLLVGVLCFAKIKSAADWLVEQVKWNGTNFNVWVVLYISDLRYRLLCSKKSRLFLLLVTVLFNGNVFNLIVSF